MPRRLLVLFATVTLISGLFPAATSALPKDRLDPSPIDDVPNPPFIPPAAGFDWSTPSRFGLDADGNGIIDYHWDPATATYDHAYVNPSGFVLNFDGCQTEEEAASGLSANTYAWAVDGADAGAPTNSCLWQHTFSAEGDYDVAVTITTLAGATMSHSQIVTVKDVFIVSIGDSYGSGEGNPDIPQKFDDLGFVSAGAKWVDERCHRSATAGAAQAAMAIERGDSKSSVTFISLACSGGTIDSPIYNGDKFEGSGMLGPFRGTVPPNPDDYSPGAYLKSQLQVLSEVANGREIDALIVSGGGNDIHFADIIADCVWHNMPRVFGTGGRCHEQPAVLDRLRDDMAELPNRYDRLANALTNPTPDGRPALNIKNVYITEYPDPTGDANGETCSSMLGEIVPATPFDFAKIHIDRDEAEWARNSVIIPLNNAIRDAAERHADKGWHFVTGISEQFARHGYCANDNWVVRPYESARQQGPVWKTTTSWGPIFLLELREQKGTMHPNAAGQRAYARQVVKALTAADGPGPSFTASTTSGAIASRVGAAGWLTGVCDAGGGCASDRAVLTIATFDAAGLRGASLTVNGADCAAVAGVTCAAALGSDGVYRWTIEIAADGIHQFAFAASNLVGASSTFQYDAKVDLHDPIAPTATVVAGLPGANGWYRSAVDVRFDGRDTIGGSGVALIEYHSLLLDGDTRFSAGPGASASFGQDKVVPAEGWTLPDGMVLDPGTVLPAAEGEYLITYQAVDQAGRRSAEQTLIVQIDKTQPAVFCDAADGQWHAADVSIRCVASDAASGLDNASDATFALSTNVTFGTETTGAATGSRQVCDVAGNCSIAGPVSGNRVDKNAPEITLTSPTDTIYVLNQSVIASYTCADGGSGVAGCTGPVTSGAAIDTASAGTKQFTVDAIDNVGNAATVSVGYGVTYNIATLYDQDEAHRPGSSLPVRLRLTDAKGANVSDAEIILNAVQLTTLDGGAATRPHTAISANRDSNFRYDSRLRGYVYDFQIRGRVAGVWAITFTVAGDPVEHTVTFRMR